MTNSSDSKTDPSFDDDTLVWEQLSAVLEAFADAWEAEPEPDIAGFIPRDSPALRRISLIELVKVDMEFRSLRKLPWDLGTYLEKWPILLDDGDPPLDLICEDIQIRQQVGQQVSMDDYAKRYPGCETALNRMLGTAFGSTTSVRNIKKISEFEPGEEIDDFQVVAELGKGAFATVYLARQISMQRLVALKVSADKGVEHQVLAKLDHPNIVRVFDVRTNKRLSARLLYMQYVSGGTLQDAMKHVNRTASNEKSGQQFLEAIDKVLVERGELPPQDSENRNRIAELSWPRVVAQIGKQIAEALNFAHQQKILHRDLKPANVLVAANGSPKLVDFNISHCSKMEGVSPAAYFGGSMAYMSPEQLEAFSPDCSRGPDELDGRADVFSLGCVLYEMLTSVKPFDAVPSTGNWRHMLDETIRQRKVGLNRVARLRLENAPPLLAQAIEQCLAPNPEDRFASPNPLSRQLDWATDPEIEKIVLPSKGFLPRLIERFPTMAILFIAAVISGFSAWFITAYNIDKSVPEELHQLFDRSQKIVNAIAFTSAFVTMALVTRILSQTLSRIRNRQPVDLMTLQQASARNLVIGYWGSCICIGMWVTAGFVYPMVLQLVGGSLPASAWFDFIGSHLLAGLVTGAFSFVAVAYLALRFWQPCLFHSFLRSAETPDIKSAITKLGYLLGVYQFIAVLIPMLAIALLVLWGDAKNKQALAALSIAAVICIPLLFGASNQIKKRLETIERMSV